MAQVIEPMSNTASVGSSGNPLSQVGEILNAIFTNGFVVFLVILILLGVGVVALIIWKMKKESELHEQDNPVYAQYKSHLRSSVSNKVPSWIKKTYSLKNILLFGLPIFWNEHSLKLTDLNNNLIGYYRGQTQTHKGETIYCVYKKKSWIFFEDLFLIRTINNYIYQTKKEIKDTKGKVLDFEIITENTNFDNYYRLLPQEADYRNKKILEIQCIGIEEDGFYYTPSYTTKDEKGRTMVMDLRPEFRRNLKEYTTDEQYKRLLRDSGTSVDEAIRTNPNVTANKHWIEKTEDEARRDEETPRREL